MSPMRPRSTASGLTMTKVLSTTSQSNSPRPGVVRRVDYFTSHFTHQVEASGDHDEVVVGRAFTGVRQGRDAAGMLEGLATGPAHRLRDVTGAHRARRQRRATVKLSEAQCDQRTNHVVDVATGQHTQHAASLT